MPRISIENYDTVASWNGSQDLFIVEQTDGTKVATPAQVKEYVLGNMDDVPTADSNNPVKSGGIFSTMGVPKIDTATGKMILVGGGAFGGNIDSTPTAGSNNAVSSGGTKTYVDNAVSDLLNIRSANITGVAQSCTVYKVGKIKYLVINNFNNLAQGNNYANLADEFRAETSFSTDVVLRTGQIVRIVTDNQGAGKINFYNYGTAVSGSTNSNFCIAYI